MTTYRIELVPLIQNIEKVIVGKRQAISLMIVSMLSKGHVLLEDVPGVGKTMMIRALAKSMGMTFKRVQFTPDLLPSDVTGVSIYHPKSASFEFRPGPIMGNIVLADEINRTSPKTQAALLEAMEESSVTVDGETYALPEPHIVLATQNPMEYEGTYPLPEAQLDRFLIKMNLGYPTFDEELELLRRSTDSEPIDTITEVMTKEMFVRMQQQVLQVRVDRVVKEYIVLLAQETRKHAFVKLGVSPRGSLAFLHAAQALAYLCNRDYVIPDDVKFLAPYVMAHRLILTDEARFQGITVERLIRTIIQKVPIPEQKVSAFDE